MQEKQPKIFGIAHHSPLDVEVLIPSGMKVTMLGGDGDILFTPKVSKESPVPYHFVFASVVELNRHEIRKIDCDTHGRMVKLTAKMVDYLLKPQAKK